MYGDALEAGPILHRIDIVPRLGARHVDRHAAGDGDAVDLPAFSFQCDIERTLGIGVDPGSGLTCHQGDGVDILFFCPLVIRVARFSDCLAIFHRIASTYALLPYYRLATL